jgi:N utilization substance protein B
MASRYDIRSVLIQTLFEADFRGVLDNEHAIQILKRNVLEYLELQDIPEFAETIILGVILKKDVLDEIIQKAAPEWPINKISVIDRALLRLGLFELIFGESYNIPHKVAINEAIELSKAFGGDSSRKFVNGVLGGVYKEIANQNGEEKVEKKSEIVKLAGALVYSFEENVLKIALVYDMFKYWTLPKGRLLENENSEDCAKRKVLEEIGIQATILQKLEENQYVSGVENGVNIKKQVEYFLAEAKYQNLAISKEDTGILDAKWFTETELQNLKIYKDIKPILKKGIILIKEKNI